MIQRLQKSQHEEEGFTLVELLVVIVILGILAAIVVFAVGGITNKGTTASNSTDVAVMQAAEEAFFAASTTVPPGYASMDVLLSSKLLRTPSTLSAVCLNGAVTVLPVAAGPATDYVIIPQIAAPGYADKLSCDGLPGIGGKVGFHIAIL
jgi:prepilin-type N-terminal cleavage/methylation domain-containing protein